jgi:hypothetical protein
MRRLLILLATLTTLAGGASFLVWRWAIGQMEAQFAGWVAARQAQGWTVSHGPAERGGWPLAADLTLPDLSLNGAAAAIPNGVAWSGKRVTLRVQLLEPHRVQVLVAGSQRLRVGPTPAVPFTAQRFVLSVPLPPDGPPHTAMLDAAGVRLASGVTIGVLQGQAERLPQSVAFRATSEAIAFPPPPAIQPPLGSHIASASLQGELIGALPGAPTPAVAAAAWQAAGGRLEVQQLALGWGPLGVAGRATVALDEALQPAGTANLHLVGFDAALAALAAGHVISPHAAQAAEAVLGLMATRPAGDGAATVDLPLTLRDRTLTMGRIPLLKLPELFWPDATGSATMPP